MTFSYRRKLRHDVYHVCKIYMLTKQNHYFPDSYSNFFLGKTRFPFQIVASINVLFGRMNGWKLPKIGGNGSAGMAVRRSEDERSTGRGTRVRERRHGPSAITAVAKTDSDCKLLRRCSINKYRRMWNCDFGYYHHITVMINNCINNSYSIELKVELCNRI